MMIDTLLRLANAEGPPGGGAAAGGIGATSAALALDPSGIMAQIQRAMTDMGSGRELALNLNVLTEYTCATFGATLEIQLISLPILASKLADAAGGPGTGKLLSIAATLTIATERLTASSATTGSLVAHGLPFGTPVYLTALATTTGVANNTIYYVIPDTTDSIQLATTLANAIASPAVPINLATGDGTATLNFIPTVHGSTGQIPLYSAGSPTNQGPLRAGERIQIPLNAKAHRTPKSLLTPAGYLQPLGAGPTLGLIGANAQRYYYLRYIPSAAITGGTCTVDLIADQNNGLETFPTAFQNI